MARPAAAVANVELEPPLPPPPPPPPPPPLIITDPSFLRLRNRYILFRPGETIFEAADLVDSNPINKGAEDRGLTAAGRSQVRRAAELLRERGVDAPIIFYDNGARATQTADILGDALSIPRNRMEPEFRWLEARGYGAFEGGSLRDATSTMRALDARDVDNRPEESEDGTPSDSANDVFSRMRNTIAKIESTYGGGDVVIVPGDATVLSVFAAVAAGVDLRDHSRFELRPGTFYDLRALVRDVRAGTFEPLPLAERTEGEIARGRAAIRDIGPKLFSETEAGSWVLGPGVSR